MPIRIAGNVWNQNRLIYIWTDKGILNIFAPFDSRASQEFFFGVTWDALNF